MRTFFGLDNKYIESVYDSIFCLIYHGKWVFSEAYSLPIKIRNWFVQRLSKQFDLEAKEIEKNSR